MSHKILVAYATRAGSTAGVAQAIAATLSENGLPAEARPMREVTDLAGYTAVIAGSAIQAKAWLPEALEFVHTHQVALKQIPFAAFLVCMTMALKNEKWRQQADIPSWLNPIRAFVTPVSEAYFAGSLDISKVESRAARIGFRLSVLFGAWAEGDHRDWTAIRAWAGTLPPLLH